MRRFDSFASAPSEGALAGRGTDTGDPQRVAPAAPTFSTRCPSPHYKGEPHRTSQVDTDITADQPFAQEHTVSFLECLTRVSPWPGSHSVAVSSEKGRY